MPRANTVKRERAPPEHVEQVQDAALLTLKQLLQLRGVNARHRDMRTHTINHERKQQKDEPATQVSVLVGFG